MKKVLIALAMTLSIVIVTSHSYAEEVHIFSEEVLVIVKKHWVVNDKLFVELDPYVCEHLTDGMCQLLDKTFEEAANSGWWIKFVGDCRPYPGFGPAYHKH